MKKRVLAIMLACLMLVSLLPMGALAAGEELKCPGKGENHYLDNCTSTFVETVAPVCGDAKSFGYDLYSCNSCGDYFAANFVQGNKDEKHDYVLVEDKDGYCSQYVCSKCGAVDEDKSHDWADATCTEPKTCKVCGKTDGKPAGHKFNAEPDEILVDPNEETFESGWAVYNCAVKGCDYSKTVEILAHKCAEHMELVEAKAATCVQNGNIEHFACSVCGRLFAYNKDGKLVEVTAADVTIAGKHSVPTTTIEEDVYWDYVISNKTGKLTITVNFDGELWVGENYVWAEAGSTWMITLTPGTSVWFYVYDETFEQGAVRATYTAVVEDNSKITITEPDCDSTGLKVYTCTVCKEKVEEVLPFAHDWKTDYEHPAGCTTYGYIIYVCHLCGENKFEVTNPTGHERPEDAQYIEATCSNNAFYSWYCEDCGWTEEEVPGTALGHDLKTVTVAPTCSEIGYTYTYCARTEDWYGTEYFCCDGLNGVQYMFTLNMTVPGDGNGDGKVDKDETITYSVNLGEGMYIANFKLNIKLDPTNHTEPDDATAVLKPATCTENGLKAFWCANCEESVVEIIPAFGHTKADKPVTVPATCQTKGYVAYMCTVCGKIAELVEELTYVNEVIYDTFEEIAHQHVDKNGNSTLTIKAQWLPEDFDGCPNVGMTRWECTLCKEVMLVKGEHVAPSDLPDRYATLTFSSKDNWGYHSIENPFFGYDAYVTYTVIAPEGYEAGTHYEVMYGSNTVVPADMEQILVYINNWSSEEIIVVANFTFDYFKAADATCELDGWTAQFCCTECGTFIESETYEVLEWSEDGKTPVKEAHPELKKLGHDKVVLVEAIKDTCTVVGRTEGWFCKTCGYEEKSVEVDVIKGHALVVADGTAFSEHPISGVLCVCANGCGYEAILNFNRICDHDWVLDRKNSSASTCTKAGFEVYNCSICGATKKVELALAAHVNKAGQIILECSETPKEDRKCVNCEQEIKYNGKGHVLNTKEYAASCLRPAYLMITCTCTGCDYAVAYEYGEALGHDWKWEAYVTDPKTGVIVGGAYRCEACDASEVRSLENIAISFTIENAANAKGEITDGSLVKVTVYATGKADSVWGFKFNVPYSSNMTLIKTDYCVDVSDDFVIYGNANKPAKDAEDQTKWVTIAGNATGAADVAINGTIALVELYFVVDQGVPGVVSVDIENVEVLNYKSEPVGFIAYGKEANTVALMDVNVDGELNMEDILATYKLIVDGKYAAAADVDKNGVVEAADLQAMYKYLIGAKTYAATRKTGIAAT